MIVLRARRLGGLLQRLRGDAHTRRARRVVLLVLLLWLLSGFDLLCTMLAHRTGGFTEANPVAAGLLHDPAALVMYKVGMVAFASMVLVAFRRRRFTELACWCVSAVYVGLSGIWWCYYFLAG